MKKALGILGATLALAMGCSSIAFAENPTIQTIYTADPAPMVDGDTLYIYADHDEDNSTWYVMKDWRCYSSKDMVNWTDHGVVMSLKTFSWAKGDAWAGQCIKRNGKYYYYVPMTAKNGSMAVGVGVSDSPTGPFVDALGHPLVQTGTGDIDPTVYIDNDGQAYLYWGNPNLWYVKLNEDMISFDTSIGNYPSVPGAFKVPLDAASFGAPKDTKGTSLYTEGPWFYRRGDLYYMVYAASGIPENICYSTSKTPTGPWTYGGIIMPTQGHSFTNHSGVADFKGHSYFFYHNGALPGGSGFDRSISIEEFKYNQDGTFPTINMTTGGPAAIANLDPYVRNEAETIAWESSIDPSIASSTKYGVETEPCSKGGMDVCSINNGDYVKVNNVDFGTTGAGTFTAGITSATKGGSIEVHLDSTTGPAIGTLPISYTGEEDNWKEETTNISNATGVHDLYFVYKGESTDDLFKVDYWKFDQKSTAHDLVAVNASIDNYKIDTVSGANTAKMNVTAIYADGTSEDVTNKAVATPVQDGIVNISNGTVTGVAYGSTNINVSYGGKTGVLNMVVKDLKSELTVKKLTISNNPVVIRTGNTASFTVTAEYLDGHTKDVTSVATYDNPHQDIAVVSNGKITTKSSGTTDVTLSFKGDMGDAVTSKLSITVSDNLYPYNRVEAESMDDKSGVDTENTSDTDGVKNIGWIENGDWIKYKNVDFGSGAASFDARVASGTSGGNIELHLDSLTGPLVGTLAVNATGAWQNWTTKSCTVDGAKGVHDLYMKFTGGSGYLLNINWWNFNAGIVTPPSSAVEQIENGGFENGLSPWQPHDKATVSVTTAAAFSGADSLLVSNRKGTGDGLQQSLTGKLKPGVTYKFSGKVRYDAGPDTRTFNMNYQDGDYKTIKIMGSVTASKGQWATIEGTYTTTSEAITAPLIFFETSYVSAADPVNDLMDFYVDDVSFAEVTQAQVPATGITLGTNTLSLATGNIGQLTAAIAPVNATNSNVTWASSNEAVAKVDNTGKVIAVAAGTAVITATAADGGFKATCNVTVTDSIPIPSNDFTVDSTFNLTDLQPEKMVDAKTIVTNNKSSEQSVMAIVALYDANNTMVNMSYISKKIAANGTENLNSGFKLPSNVNGYKVKVFVWNGTDLISTSMQPISNVVTLQ